MRQSEIIQDFSRGLDLVSSAPDIPPGYTPNAQNFRISEYGGIEKTLGFSQFADLGSGVSAHDLTDFTSRDATITWLVAASSTKWQSVSSLGVVADLRTGMIANTDTTFVVYDDLLYGLDAHNNLASWDGTGAVVTHAPGVNTGPSQGIILGIWQNSMWIAKATAGKIGFTVQWSDVNNFTGTNAWPATQEIILDGAGNSARIIGGMPTPDGLVVFTTESTYIIYDSDSGANNVVDPRHGCSCRRSLALYENLIYGVNKDGIFRTNGRFPLQNVSRRVQPLFVNESPDLSTAAGVRYQNSYFLSYDRSLGYNDLTLELSPLLEHNGEVPIMANTALPAACWAVSPIGGHDHLYMVAGISGSKRLIAKAFTGGSQHINIDSVDLHNPITCYYELPWDPLGDERHLKRLHNVRVVGRGSIAIGARADYAESGGLTAAPIPVFNSGQGSWDVDNWDQFNWAGYSVSEGFANIPTLARRFSINITESSVDSFPSRNPLNQPSGSELGACGVYLLEPYFSLSSRRR